MQYQYDKDADATYILINDLPHGYSKEIDESRFVDYAKDGTVIGIELLYVSGGVDTSDLPFAAEVEKLLQEHGIRVYV